MLNNAGENVEDHHRALCVDEADRSLVYIDVSSERSSLFAEEGEALVVIYL
jgi:hypothetical protein